MRKRVPNPTPNPAANGQPAENGQAHNGPLPAVTDGTAPNAQRTATGQFTKGNKCGLGNPFARRMGAMRSAFLNAITDTDVAAVARKMAELAAAGDVQAASVFLAYAVGKPQPSVNPDRLDLDEFSIADAAPSRARLLSVVLGGIHPSVAAEIVRTIISSSVPAMDVLKKCIESIKVDEDEDEYADEEEQAGAVAAMTEVVAEDKARVGKPIR